MIVLSLQSHRKTLNNEPDSDHISLNGRLSNVTRGEVDKTGPIVFFSSYLITPMYAEEKSDWKKLTKHRKFVYLGLDANEARSAFKGPRDVIFTLPN
jgi:hypothetical protein